MRLYGAHRFRLAGFAAAFLFGGRCGADRAARIVLLHGDVVVWGGADRLRYHGVAPLKRTASMICSVHSASI